MRERPIRYAYTTRAFWAVLIAAWGSGFLMGVGVVAVAYADDECGVDAPGVCSSPMPDVAQSICTARDLGLSPGEIAEGLHNGDPRWSTWQTTQTVWNQLEAGCP